MAGSTGDWESAFSRTPARRFPPGDSGGEGQGGDNDTEEQGEEDENEEEGDEEDGGVAASVERTEAR